MGEVVRVDIQAFLLLILLQTVFTSFIVYMVFYVFFQKVIASRVPSLRDEVTELPVMGGFIVDKVEAPSITEIVVDILKRAWGRGSKVLERGIASYLSDWYFIGLLLLIALVVVLLILG